MKMCQKNFKCDFKEVQQDGSLSFFFFFGREKMRSHYVAHTGHELPG